jgi:hypothetical protein
VAEKDKNGRSAKYGGECTAWSILGQARRFEDIYRHKSNTMDVDWKHSVLASDQSDMLTNVLLRTNS